MFDYLCTDCRQGMVRETRKPYEVRWRGMTFRVDEAQLGVCDHCGAENFDGGEYKRWIGLFEKEIERRQKPLAPDEIKRIRLALGLNPRQLALLIGCSHQSIYNWENPKRRRPPERQADLMIRLLEVPEALGFLLRRAEEIGIVLPRVTPRRMPDVRRSIREQTRRAVPVTA